MASELKIRWHGDVPGISEHRLSLDAFAKPLELLLAALRRIATQMVSTAIEDEHPRSGRFANVARWLDIEVKQVIGGSAGIDAYVVFRTPPDELNLWSETPSRATVELLDAIEMESQGKARNGAVRKYLSALPVGVHRQEYEYTNGSAKKRIEVGDMKLTELPLDLPFLRLLEGNVVGVGFEPGRTEVRIKTEALTTSLNATPDAVDRAIELRHEKVRTLDVQIGSRSRLISLNRASERIPAVVPDALRRHIFQRWDKLLTQLAK